MKELMNIDDLPLSASERSHAARLGPVKMRTPSSAILILAGSLLLTTACGPEFGDPIEEPTLACAQSCAGCCSGETCFKEGNQFNACGSKGIKCALCTGTTSCQKNATEEFACTLDKGALWRVQPVSASIALTTPAGFDWDVDGSPPDVVVNLVCPPKAVPAPAQAHAPETSSFTPQWTGIGCDATSDALLQEPTSIEVLDVDVAFDDEIASTSYTFTAQDFEAGMVVLQLPDKTGTLTIQLLRKN